MCRHDPLAHRPKEPNLDRDARRRNDGVAHVRGVVRVSAREGGGVVITTKYAVSLSDDRVRDQFETAEDAVDFAAGRIYLRTPRATLVDELKAGRLIQWSYGFGNVTIYPPGVEIR
jgi:hypothetical protein